MEATPMEPNGMAQSGATMERIKVSAKGKAKSTTTASTKGKAKLKAPPRITATVQHLPATAAEGEQFLPDAWSETQRELLQRIQLAYPSDLEDETKDDPDVAPSNIGKCKKGFPQPLQATTTEGVDGYAKYRRDTAADQYCVPHNPYLVHSHINVERPDLLDEAREYVEGRYVTSLEAITRIRCYDLQRMSHAVEALTVHEKDQQHCTYEETHDAESVVASNQKTKLISFFLACAQGLTGINGVPAKNCLYLDFPQYFPFRKHCFLKDELLPKCIPNVCTDKIGKCKKGFPQPLQATTTEGVDGYAKYRRDTAADQYCVPHNPYLVHSHINVEVCTSIKAVKYLYKYVYKGSDRTCLTRHGNTLKDAT
ncbi:hypothetical protein H257_14254 [Aphanomyces astaci]|uniref:Uncharacterized protein n=1 Tax=Aphanomyces astaci TaxID=112090 RepID=W4FRX2_APHAT|nr:hypothetical protein H257_14254 [Aphanomyces astaci]ETV70227.1 hypothetical protein H257_14254 [Aphanomyces astaci]|eukprot:XP_009840323.1 hypothetical protein H257_14254 [Aphanomyces astaci]